MASSSVRGPATQPLPLEASWINAEPFDEFIREISDFIATVSKGHTHVEVRQNLLLCYVPSNSV